MFTREEGLALWDDFLAEKDAFLSSFGELVFTRTPKFLPRESTNVDDKANFGYFVKARNVVFNHEMLAAYMRVCEKHQCSFRVETQGEHIGITFYKSVKKGRDLPV